MGKSVQHYELASAEEDRVSTLSALLARHFTHTDPAWLSADLLLNYLFQVWSPFCWRIKFACWHKVGDVPVLIALVAILLAVGMDLTPFLRTGLEGGDNSLAFY